MLIQIQGRAFNPSSSIEYSLKGYPVLI